MTVLAAAGVWIDARSATLLRWTAGTIEYRRFESTVPPHHRSSGESERGLSRHGGGGAHSAGEAHRLEHLRAFLSEVRAALPAYDVLILGDGVVGERLARELGEEDAHHRRVRRIAVEHSERLSEAQLLERVRAFAGSPARRQRPRSIPHIRPPRTPRAQPAPATD